MNLQHLRERLVEIEAEAGTDRILVKFAAQGPKTDIDRIDLAAYRDGGETSYVAWLVPPER